jgi:hypothetical protein
MARGRPLPELSPPRWVLVSRTVSQAPRRCLANKVLQLTRHSTFQSTSGRVLHCNVGASSELRRSCGSQLSVQSLGRRGSQPRWNHA